MATYMSKKGNDNMTKDYTPKQGGLSDAVWNQHELQQYIKSGGVFGYVGGSRRTDKGDVMLEKEFTKRGMGPRAIAIWLTSTSGRHLCDNPLTEKSIASAAEHAPKEVVVWSHPEHNGTYGATVRLTNILTEEQAKVFLHYIG